MFMAFVPIMWSVWGLTVLIMAIMFLYRSRLTKDEEDQIYLDESANEHQAAQQAIVARVKKVQPLIRVSEIGAAVATLFVIGYYINDVINQFK
jgi:type VI protein secretion system component VasK